MTKHTDAIACYHRFIRISVTEADPAELWVFYYIPDHSVPWPAVANPYAAMLKEVTGGLAVRTIHLQAR